MGFNSAFEGLFARIIVTTKIKCMCAEARGFNVDLAGVYTNH
jgi:hypothetical protein